MTQLSIDEIADLIATNTARSESGSEERTELEEYEASGVVAVA